MPVPRQSEPTPLPRLEGALLELSTAIDEANKTLDQHILRLRPHLTHSFLSKETGVSGETEGPLDDGSSAVLRSVWDASTRVQALEARIGELIANIVI
jgi:hypothetical protein